MRRGRAPGRPGRERGFVLAVTLWVLAALALAVGAFTVWTQSAVKDASRLRSAAQARREEMSVLASLRYSLGVRTLDVAGLPPAPQTAHGFGLSMRSGVNAQGEFSVHARGDEIRLDGQPYVTGSGVRFAIQDTAGLLNADSGDDQHVSNLLGLLGIARLKRGPMLAKLLDYIDPDSLVRLNGAEAPQYKAKGLPPPPNRHLITPMEAYRVLGWSSDRRLWRNRQWARFTTAAHFGPLNLNTAPKKVLETIAGINPSQAARIVRKRVTSPFVVPEQGFAAGGVNGLDPFNFITYPSRYLRIELWMPGTAFVRCYDLELTPEQGHAAPWTLVTYHLIPVRNLPRFANETPEKAPGYLFAAAPDAGQ